MGGADGADAGGAGPIKGPGSTGCSGTTCECAAAAASDKLVLLGGKLMPSLQKATIVVLSFSSFGLATCTHATTAEVRR